MSTLTLNPGDLVRIDPKSPDRKNHSAQHWGRGRVVAVDPRHVHIKPFRHAGKVERVEHRFVKFWKAKNF